MPPWSRRSGSGAAATAGRQCHSRMPRPQMPTAGGSSPVNCAGRAGTRRPTYCSPTTRGSKRSCVHPERGVCSTATCPRARTKECGSSAELLHSRSRRLRLTHMSSHASFSAGSDALPIKLRLVSSPLRSRTRIFVRHRVGPVSPRPVRSASAWLGMRTGWGVPPSRPMGRASSPPPMTARRVSGRDNRPGNHRAARP
jgi:hypothetical protein